MKGTGRPTFGEPSELEIGQTVYLYPNTRQASRNVHRFLEARVGSDAKIRWPMVEVVWREEGADTESREVVHKDNLRSRPHTRKSGSADRKEGDSVGGGADLEAKVRKLSGSAKPIDLCDGLYEEDVLF